MPKTYRYDDWGRDRKIRCVTGMHEGFFETKETALAFKSAMFKETKRDRLLRRKRAEYQRRKLRLAC